MISKVAVIMSVYKNDGLENLKKAVDSILHQSYRDLNLMLYVDGDIAIEVREYLIGLPAVDARCSVDSSKTNHGLAVALNVLIDRALTTDGIQYIARMDSDDISRPSRIERQVSFLRKHADVDVCGTSCKEFGASFALQEKHLPAGHDELVDFSIAWCPFIHPTVMFRAKLFWSGARYPVDTGLTEDMAMWFSLLEKGTRFANIREVLLDYRLNEQTLARRRGVDKAFNEFYIRMKYMFILHRVTLKNLVLVGARLVFHVLPIELVKYAYKNRSH